MIPRLLEELDSPEGVPGRSQELVGELDSNQNFQSNLRNRIESMETELADHCGEGWSKGESLRP